MTGGEVVPCVAFDFDGTLVESNEVKRQAYFDVSAVFGDVREVVEEVLRVETGNRRRVLAAIAAKLETVGRLPADRSRQDWADYLVESYTRLCEERIAVSPSVPGAMAALEALHSRGHALYINSATPTGPLEAILARRGMKRWFKGVFGSPQGKVENLARVLATENIGPSSLIFVGDNEVDFLAAVEIGCPFIGLRNAFSGYSQTPAILIPDLTWLIAAVDSLGRGRPQEARGTRA